MKEDRVMDVTRWRRLARWLAAAALAVALAPAVARAHDRTASLQPEQIRVVQRALRGQGFQVDPTGAWDEQTQLGLASFQSTNGLPATGRLDAETSRALGVDPATVMPVGGRRAAAPADPAADCELNTTVDCRPGP